MKSERRLSPGGIELRAGDDDQPTRVVGYAAVFDALSEDLGGFREKIAAGAFSKTLGGDVRALFNHDESQILGRTKSGTLRLTEDNHGLLVDFTPPETAAAEHVIEAMRRGDIDQMSFGFRTRGDIWEETDGEIVRTLTEVELFDVSLVTFPAYPQTEAALRGLDAWRDEHAPDHRIYRARLRLAAA